MKEFDELLKELNLDSSELTDEQLAQASGGSYLRDRDRLKKLIVTLYNNPDTEDKAIEIVSRYTNGSITLSECISELEALQKK